MQEKQVTVDGTTHILPQPFMVCATQNPVGLTGTYPLPEAQLDRFLIRIAMGYPKQSDEITILEKNKGDNPLIEVNSVATVKNILKLQKNLEEIKCAQGILKYIVELAEYTRTHKDVSLGISPRASIALMRASMGVALMQGRNYVLPDDVQKMVKPVFSHRMVMHSQALIQNRDADSVIDAALQTIKVPAMYR